jgi:hypothetical protein
MIKVTLEITNSGQSMGELELKAMTKPYAWEWEDGPDGDMEGNWSWVFSRSAPHAGFQIHLKRPDHPVWSMTLYGSSNLWKGSGAQPAEPWFVAFQSRGTGLIGQSTSIQWAAKVYLT